MLLESGSVTVEDRGIDQFERVLAYVWVDGELVNLTSSRTDWALPPLPSQMTSMAPTW